MQFPIQRLLNRATWIKVHVYLALIAGFFFALMGLTGSLSVYREELDELLNPELVIEQPEGKRQSLDKIMAAVQAAHPNRYG
ncbi:MAG: PepSY domain-containing protein, partial [Methylobacter sp.]